MNTIKHTKKYSLSYKILESEPPKAAAPTVLKVY